MSKADARGRPGRPARAPAGVVDPARPARAQAPKASAVAVNDRPTEAIVIASEPGVALVTVTVKSRAVMVATVAVPDTVTPLPPARVSVPVPWPLTRSSK